MRVAKHKKEDDTLKELGKKGNNRTDEEESEYQLIFNKRKRQDELIKNNQSQMMSGVKLASGGIVTKRINNATIGEAGPEAVIPLSKASQYGLGNNDEVIMLLKQLVTATQTPGIVEIDSAKSGTISKMRAFKMN
jgi:hypothetical protein